MTGKLYLKESEVKRETVLVLGLDETKQEIIAVAACSTLQLAVLQKESSALGGFQEFSKTASL